MVNIDKIIFDEPIYFMPDYCGTIKVSVIELLDNKKAVVKQCTKDNMDLKPFTTEIAHIYTRDKDATIGRRAWEHYMRRRKKAKKELKDDRFG